MIVIAHNKFGLVRIQGSEVKRGEAESAPRSERVFEIPVRIGLNKCAFSEKLTEALMTEQRSSSIDARKRAELLNIGSVEV